jgi:GNAT superfamily N-acetyltransferase
MTLAIRPLTGSDLDRFLPDVARLRMQVFRDWPYLYEGSFEYEHRYLQSYRDSAGAILVGVFDGSSLVGVATGTPMEDHADDFARAFESTGYALGDIFYCAESVLLPEYRGKGIGHAFFDEREAHARRLGRRYAAFCAVVRPDNHPLKPIGYRPLDLFWRKRGYETLPGVFAEFQWTDLNQKEQSSKKLQFWIHEL